MGEVEMDIHEFTAETRERLIDEQEQEVGFSIELPKGTVRMIRITATKIVYHHNNKGIANAHGEAQCQSY